MKNGVVAAALVAGVFLINSSSAFSEERWGLLTPAQYRAYHACLFESWIQDYCRWNSFAYGQCVVANGGARYPLNGRLFTEDYCWETAQGLSPR
jgi:hypothetical protein